MRHSVIGLVLYLLSSFTVYPQSKPVNARVDPTVGLSYTSANFKSAWLTLGSDFFFIYQIGVNSSPDKTIFYPFLNNSVTSTWKDERLPDIEKQLNWSVGVGGKVFQHWSVYADTGITKIEIRYQFRDETHTLSGKNGLYSYPKKTEGRITCNVGTLFSINSHLKGKVSISVLDKPLQQFEAGMGVNLYR